MKTKSTRSRHGQVLHRSLLTFMSGTLFMATSTAAQSPSSSVNSGQCLPESHLRLVATSDGCPAGTMLSTSCVNSHWKICESICTVNEYYHRRVHNCLPCGRKCNAVEHEATPCSLYKQRICVRKTTPPTTKTSLPSLPPNTTTAKISSHSAKTLMAPRTTLWPTFVLYGKTQSQTRPTHDHVTRRARGTNKTTFPMPVPSFQQKTAMHMETRTEGASSLTPAHDSVVVTSVAGTLVGRSLIVNTPTMMLLAILAYGMAPPWP